MNSKKMLGKGLSTQFANAIPYIGALPTTAGTGSEGGKSAVITRESGDKVVFGNINFLPKSVGLIPQLTVSLPKHLTAATGVDALFHLMEAYFVPYDEGVAEGMTDQEIKICEKFAIDGIKIVLEWLPKAFEHPNDLKARLCMLIASLYGAKAFRKGSLGGVHATAHALGAYFHQHHGTCIARMSVPVLEFNEKSGVVPEKFTLVKKLFDEKKIKGKTLSESTKNFCTSLQLPLGLQGLNVDEATLKKLTDLAVADGCQTNPVPLTADNYSEIFRKYK